MRGSRVRPVGRLSTLVTVNHGATISFSPTSTTGQTTRASGLHEHSPVLHNCRAWRVGRLARHSTLRALSQPVVITSAGALGLKANRWGGFLSTALKNKLMGCGARDSAYMRDAVCRRRNREIVQFISLHVSHASAACLKNRHNHNRTRT